MSIFNAIIRRGFNPFLTIYFNFRFLPFKQACKLPVFIFGKWRVHCQNAKIVINGPIKRGMIWLGVNIAGYVVTGRASLRMKAGSKIIFNGESCISQGCQIYLDENALFHISKNVRLGDNVKIICYREIFIGERSEVTWESQVTDFNSHFIERINDGTIQNIYEPVRIGDFCWIGNRSTIMPGTVLPDRIIVTSNSLLNKNYLKMGIEKYSLLGGMPAKLITTGLKRIYLMESEKMLKEYFITNDFPAHYNSDGLNIE